MNNSYEDWLARFFFLLVGWKLQQRRVYTLYFSQELHRLVYLEVPQRL